MCVAKLKAPSQQAACWGCPDPACKSTLEGPPSVILSHLRREDHCSIKRLTQVMFAVCQIHTATNERFIYVCEKFGIVGKHEMDYVGLAWCERTHAVEEATLHLPGAQQPPSKRKNPMPDIQQPISAQADQQQQQQPHKRRRSELSLQQASKAALDTQQVQCRNPAQPSAVQSPSVAAEPPHCI